MATPRYSVGLGTKVLSRARKILGSLLLLSVLLIIAGVHQGVVSGEFDKVFIQPFRQFAADLEKVSVPPDPTLAPLPTASPAATPLPVKKTTPITQPVVKTQPAVSNCIRKNIREGEFASNKCYSQQDYEDLSYYLSRYSSAVSSVSFYETKVNISCSNNNFFKTCEQDKKDQQANLDNIPRYRSIIQGIIAKGQ